MEHYCRIKKKRVQYYFDPEFSKRDYLYEYQMTGWMPIYIRIIQGRIGKKFVVKHYHGKRLRSGKYRKPKIIMTRVPDMTKIVATTDQRESRNLFKEAVAFGKKVIADAELKLRWRQRYRLANCQVFNKAIKLYLLYLRKGVLIEEELRPVGWEVFIRKVEEKIQVVVQKEEEEIKEERLHGEMREELLLVELVIEREALRLAG